MIPAARQRTINRLRLTQMIGTEPGVVLLDAPVGFGKTTALMHWGSEQEKSGRTVEWAKNLSFEGNLDVLIVDDVPSDNGQNAVETLNRLRTANEALQVVVATTFLGETPAGWRRIGPEELKFTGGETTALANLLEADTARRKIAFSEADGWSLAVRAVLEGTDPADFSRALCQIRPVGADCGIPFLFGKLPRLRPELVLKTLGVTGEEVEVVLQHLLATGAVVKERDTSGSYFAAQPILNIYLQKLEGVPESVLEVIRYDHAIAEEESWLAHSVKTLLELGRLGGAEELASRQFSELLADKDEALNALRVVSLEQLEPYPTLLMIRLILERPHRFIPIATVEKMVRNLRYSLETARVSSQDPQYFMRIPMQIAASRMLGAWDEALEISYALLDEIDDPKWQPEPPIIPVSPIFHAVIALAGILAGDFALSDRAANEGYRRAVAQENRLEQVHNLALVALSFVLQGNVNGAEAALEQIDRMGGYTGLTPPEFSWTDRCLARAMVAVERRRMDTAAEALAEVLPFMERMEQWPIVVEAESQIVRQTQGAAGARVLLRKRLDEQPEDREVSPAWQVRLLTRLADLATFSGRYPESEETLGRIRTSEHLTEVTNPPVAISEARLLLYRARYATAAKVLSSCDTEPGSRGEKDLRAIRGLTDYKLGKRSQASQELRALEAQLEKEEIDALVTRLPTSLVLEVAGDLDLEIFKRSAQGLPENLRTVQYEELSESERQVLERLAAGRTPDQVCEDLFVSVNTLKTHRRNLYRKLGASSRPEAVTAARQRGILP